MGLALVGESFFVQYLEELHPNDGKHELEEARDQHDVSDSLDSHNHTLYHVLLISIKHTLHMVKQTPIELRVNGSLKLLIMAMAHGINNLVEKRNLTRFLDLAVLANV